MKIIDKFRINQMADDGVDAMAGSYKLPCQKNLQKDFQKLKRAGKFTESYLSTSNDNNANIISGQFENIK